MARKSRNWVPGAFYHVFNRENRRNMLFKDDDDYKKFLSLLDKSMFEYEFQTHAYCLMPNHYHLLVMMEERPLSQALKWLNGQYARYFNDRYEQNGHVFEHRFDAKPITDVMYMLNVSRYIHMNPVKAEIVSDPIEYKWSSYGAYVLPKDDSVINTKRIMGYFENNPDYYRQYVRQTLTEDEESILSKLIEGE